MTDQYPPSERTLAEIEADMNDPDAWEDVPSPRPPTGRRRRQGPQRRGIHGRALYAALALLVIVAVAVVAVACQGEDDPSTTAAGVQKVPPSAAVAPSTAPAVVADLPEGSFLGDVPDDRPYVVGLEITPGEYRSAGSIDPGTLGTWERYRFDSKTNGLVMRANGTSDSARTVTLRAGDTFITRGFQPWHKVP